jgi:hypothetical protein
VRGKIMDDGWIVVFLFVGMPLVVMIFVSWILHYFIALRAPPTKRAAWIAGISYVVASLFWLFGGPKGDRWEGPLAAIPGAMIIFWWFEDDALPEGAISENTNWRVGLVAVATLFGVVAIKTIFLRSAAGR